MRRTVGEYGMEIEQMQKQINAINYWDAEVFDFRLAFFGDEVEIIIEDTVDFDYSLKFIHCYKVCYEDTDKLGRSLDVLKRDFTKRKLGYYLHDIVIEKSSNKEFVDIQLTTAPLFIQLTCKAIQIERIPHHTRKKPEHS